MTDDASKPIAAPSEAVSDRPEPPRRWYSGRSVLALGVSVIALILAAAPYASPDVMGGQVRAYLLSHPEVLDEVVAARQVAEANDRVATVNAAVAANPALLAADPRDPAFGPADAKVTVIEFFDFRCPGCKSVAPEVLRLMEANPDVRFVFKEWPILDRADDTTSQYAARAALAAYRQGRYLAVHRALMAEPGLTPEGVDGILSANGVDLVAAQAAIASPDVSRHIADIHTTAATLRLTGTPTFLVNGKATASIEPQEVARAIAAARGS